MLKKKSQTKKEELKKDLQSQTFYTLPLRDLVIFPQMTSAILVGREKSLNSIHEARKLNLPIFVVTQIDPELNDFNERSIYKTGTLCNIVESVKKTRNLLVVDSGCLSAGFSAEIIAKVLERLPVNCLQNPPMRIALPDAPAPTSRFLERDYYLSSADVVKATRQILKVL